MEHRDGSVTVTFDKKEGAVGKSGHGTPRDPFGKSGGAIFGLPLLGLTQCSSRGQSSWDLRTAEIGRKSAFRADAWPSRIHYSPSSADNK